MTRNKARKTAARTAAAATGGSYTAALRKTTPEGRTAQAVAILDEVEDPTGEPVYQWPEECPDCGADVSMGSYEVCVCDDEPEGCDDCGAGAGPYDMCVCVDDAPETPAQAADRAAWDETWAGTVTAAAALAAVHRGLTVFPLPPGGRRPAPGWRDRLVSTPEQVARSWPGDGSNVAVACGPSRVVVLDVDDVEIGKVAPLARLCRELAAPYPETFRVLTPSGGFHLYFRAPEGISVPSSSGGVTGLGPGIDVRAGNGYVLAPHSVVPGPKGQNRVYLSSSTQPIAPLPTWILERITT
ncbi:bifunctional DNA primase/polymerase [Antribacter gilvus]|uniref:bifunctional DNA primase/polymerase n=1 Tax=Antribacter gilvus TaxID=2304675 RepID=UPI000F780F10|nr:bifunctional DNA primase/polymerase [Antribacter gilvus]